MKKGLAFTVGLLIGLLPWVNYTYGQDLAVVKEGDQDVVINPHVYIFKDKTADIQDIQKVAAAPDSAFRKNDRYQEVHYGFSQSSGWCKFTIKNTSSHTDWIIKVHHSRVDTVQLYIQRQNGELIPYPMTGHFQPIWERAYYSLNFGHPVSIGRDETIVCYLYSLRKFARHAAILSLQQEGYYRNYDTVITMFMGSLIGVCVLASLIGIVLFIVLYEKVYISYSIYCFSFLLLIVIDSGFVYAFINYPAQQKIINNLSIVLLYWATGLHILFTIELLKLKKLQSPRMYWLGVGSGLLFCAFALALLLPVPDPVRRQLSQWAYYIAFFLDAYVLSAMIIQMIRKEVVVFFYMAGFLFTLFAASITAFADLQWVEGVNHRTDILFIAPVIEIVFMVVGLGINSSRHVKDRIKAQRRIITVQEDERKRIAQDLHDDVGNSLAAVKTMLNQRGDHLMIEKEIEDIISHIRNISHDLMPVDFEKYLLPDVIRQTVFKFRGHPGIRFEYTQTGTPIKLHPVAELVVYRIVNELITNSIKHSQATHTMIQLAYQEAGLMLMVEDNGTGIKKEADRETGIGLKNIRHRVAYIDATLTIESDERGTLFIVAIPYRRQR